ncbi:helix-turn-helix domain-containing protein [Asinibacterium sp. OR53]|uniref:helix-turn-helix domain-containing protein n=1 Tax=Asinibacterium sp. OR53 TaxID=925409 RepID=UPI000565BD8A|nr:helix-turn-helix domain-containing protein [Asinibacterium sp. OR53]
MSYIEGLQKNEFKAFLQECFATYLAETKALKDEIVSLKSLLKNQPKDFYQIADLMELFGVTRATIHNWVKEGKLLKHKLGGKVLFKREDINKLIELSKISYEKNK